MRRIRTLIALALLATACKKSGPEAVALQYERERVRGDVAKARGYLSAADEADLTTGRAKVGDAELATAGVPEATVDSGRTLYDDGDSARVAVFFTGPNMQQAMAGLMRRAMSGAKLDETDAKQSLRTVPRITFADTFALRRGQDGWRVSAGLPYRRALRDSIQFDVQLEPGFLGGFIKGTARNLSAAHLEELHIEVFDAKGESRHVNVGAIAPHGQTKIIEMATLSPGKASKVEITAMKVSKTGS
jgi:hypothetical protein